MTSADIPLLLLLGFTLVAAVFLAAAEASLLRVTEVQAHSLARDEGDARSLRLRSLINRLPAVLNLILLLALMAQIGAASITGFLAQRWFGSIGVTIASIMLTIVLFVYGEAIPKTFAIRHASRTALWVTGPVAFLERLLRPLVSLLVWIADIQLPGKGIETSPTVTESELRLLAHRAAREGEITGHDQTLIERAFVFGDRSADDVMIPRPDIVALDASTALDDAIATALRKGHRRLPVFVGSLENIIGVVKLRDMIEARDEEDPADLAELVQPSLHVPESMSLTTLLDQMQASQRHLAIVIDEYGVTSGLVTVEDIAGELLGTISEDPGAPDFDRLDDGSWQVAGKLPVEDLARTGMSIPEGEWNTAAGLMVGLAGRLLTLGDSVEVDGFRMTVIAVRRRRITRIAIQGRDES